MIREPVEQTVRRLAYGRCEYCKLPESATRLRHVLDHVIARQHGGSSEIENLALCCGHCNSSKGPNIAGLDPHTGKLTRLFHPRNDEWGEHFSYEGATMVGRTDVGRTTILVLAVNTPIRVLIRQSLLGANGHFF